MPVTVRGGDILFNDGSTQSTAAGAPTTTQVLNATAAASLGSVGSYAMLSRPLNDPGTVLPGNTVAGSSMRYAGGFSFFRIVISLISTTGPAGTWRCMGLVTAGNECGLSSQSASLFLRIS